jgi:hypothetical protein
MERVIPKIERPVWTGPVMESAEVLQPVISPLPGGIPLN